MFRNWPTRRDKVEFVRIQLPFRENRTREAHFGTYEQLADALIPGIACYLDRPYAFFGHCGGVLPAYEAALRTVELGVRPPACFVASSQVVPHRGPHGRFLWLSQEDLDEEIRALLRRTTGTDAFPEEVLDVAREILDADLEANRRYAKPTPVQLTASILAIAWDRDVEVPAHLMSAWSECGTLANLRTLPGDHYTFLDAPEELLELIERVLLTTGANGREGP